MKKVAIGIPFCLALLQACGGGSEISQSLSLTSIGNKNVLAGESLNFTVSASDPNGSARTYMADGTNNVTNPLSLTDRVSFSETTGAFTWNTLVSDAGNYNIVFSVTNNASPAETDSESIIISVQNIIAYGEELYIDHCEVCHGTDGAGGSAAGLVQASSPLDVRTALGLEGSAARSGMGGIAAEFANATRDANAIGYFLCNAGGLDINNTQQCPVD